MSSLGTAEAGASTFPAQSPQTHPDWTGSGPVPTLAVAGARSTLIGLGLSRVPRPHLGWGEGRLVPPACQSAEAVLTAAQAGASAADVSS